jgi:hypothetical protein
MKRSALFAAAILLPAIAAAQETDQTGSIKPINPVNVVTEQQARDRLAAAGFTAIGTLARDADGMMSVAVNQDGDIEDR